ncbi:MAG: hypothetical protein IJH77_04475 [Mogibacterium sp.]|nr:hypothetical protein [Mogibacterium sp.]
MSKKKLLITALCLVLAVGVGLAAAYFTDYEDGRGGAILHLSGRSETEEHFDGNNKIVAVKNTGEVDMVVRVLAFGDEDMMTVDADGTTWIDGGDGAYYYGAILKAGETTPELTVSVSGRVDADDPINFDITVVNESSRVVYTQDAQGNEIVKAPEGWTGFPVIPAE